MGKKHVGPTEVARAFEVKQPSVSEWMREGRIAKKHIPRLISYFADVVGPDHWGLPFTQQELEVIELLRKLPDSARLTMIRGMREAVVASDKALGRALGSLAHPESPSRKVA